MCKCHPNEKRRHVPRGLLELLSTVAIAGIVVQRIELGASAPDEDLVFEEPDEELIVEPLEPVDEQEHGGEG